MHSSHLLALGVTMPESMATINFTPSTLTAFPVASWSITSSLSTMAATTGLPLDIVSSVLLYISRDSKLPIRRRLRMFTSPVITTTSFSDRGSCC